MSHFKHKWLTKGPPSPWLLVFGNTQEVAGLIPPPANIWKQNKSSYMASVVLQDSCNGREGVRWGMVASYDFRKHFILDEQSFNNSVNIVYEQI